MPDTDGHKVSNATQPRGEGTRTARLGFGPLDHELMGLRVDLLAPDSIGLQILPPVKWCRLTAGVRQPFARTRVCGRSIGLGRHRTAARTPCGSAAYNKTILSMEVATRAIDSRSHHSELIRIFSHRAFRSIRGESQ